jgi:uncharacterized membrane protein YbhN (UPF0104 family)
MFFGQFLPGVIGPDVVRGYWIVRSRGRTAAVALSLLTDRLLGVYALTLVALVGAVIARWTGRVAGFLEPIAIFQVLILAAWLVASKTFKRLEGGDCFRHSRFSGLWDRLLAAGYSLVALPRLRGVFSQVLILSLVVGILRCGVFFSLYKAFGVTVPFVVLMVFIPMMFVAVQLPVSIGGLGVREATLVYLLSSAEVAPEVSVSVGLVYQLLQIIMSLPGVPFWLTERSRVRAGSPVAANPLLGEKRR